MKETLHTATRNRRTTIVAMVCVVVFALSTGGAGYFLATTTSNTATTAAQTQQFQEELTEALLENCRHDGNPLRKAEVEDLTEGIDDLKAEIQDPKDPRIKELFPSAPIKLAEEVIEEGNDRIRKRIVAKEERIPTTDPIKCPTRYPTTPKEEEK